MKVLYTTRKGTKMMNCDYFAVLRHGHAHNNEAEHRVKDGDPRALDHVIKLPSSLHDLTPQGADQAIKTGEAIRRRGLQFTHFIVSGYVRAMRTAQLLHLPDARWEIDDRLSERDSGIHNMLTPSGNERHLAAKGNNRHELDKYRYRPELGESFLDLDSRIRPVFESLTGRPLVVCHGHVIRLLDGVIMRGMHSWDFPHYDDIHGRLENNIFIEYKRISARGDGPERWRRRSNVPWMDDTFKETVVTRRLYSNDELEHALYTALSRIPEEVVIAKVV